MTKLIKKRENKLIPVFLIFVGLIGGYMYYSQINVTDDTISFLEEEDDDLEKFRTLKFDFDIFENEKFSNLQEFGDDPVNPGDTGKTNLFSPF